jgi:hypothetical protein
MFIANRTDNSLIMALNGLATVTAYGMLALSLYMSPDVPLSTKGYWAVCVFLLTLSLINFVKLRFDDRLAADRLHRLEEARTEKLIAEYGAESPR